MSLDLLETQIRKRHSGDDSQLSVIFSESRLLVEAPAGYGKTSTMVSKIAYMIAKGSVPYPKKLLALTFSVNAAYKIRKAVREEIPPLLAEAGMSNFRRDAIFATNYHGFCRTVLSKYGKLLDARLGNFTDLDVMSDSTVRDLDRTVAGLQNASKSIMTGFGTLVTGRNIKEIQRNLDEYCSVVQLELLPRGYISYNAILALTIKLFLEKPVLLDFYQSYYKAILVDEFQDTNWLSFWMLTKLLGDDNHIVLLGDSLQRIYGFIGAVPDIIGKAEKRYGLTKHTLEKNHRFGSNREMLLLNDNIRLNAENPSNPSIVADASIKLLYAQDQFEEATYVRNHALNLTETDGSSVVVLFRQRGANTDVIIDAFDKAEIPYFYGLFTDDDLEYTDFHTLCLSALNQLLASNRFSRRLARYHLDEMSKGLNGDENRTRASCFRLLECFWDRIFKEYPYLSNDEKIDLARDLFANNGLKQYMPFVGSLITISTVHAAKGLEWDNVILPDMETDSFPPWLGLCRECKHKSDCGLRVSQSNELNFLDELSVFYVAVTRARKDVVFSGSRTCSRGFRKNLSCLLRIPGITTR